MRPSPGATVRRNTSAAGTRAYRPPAIAARVRSWLRSGSGTIATFSARSSAVLIWSGSVATLGARRAARRSSSGSTHVTSGARALINVLMTLSAFASVACRSPSCASQWSESSAATSVRGKRLTGWPASAAVGSGAVGRGTGDWFEPWPQASVSATTHHALRTKYLFAKGLVTLFKKRA